MPNIKKYIDKTIKIFFHILIAYPLFGLSFLFKRNKNIWLISGNQGFKDNSKYFYIYLKKCHPEINTIWITNDRKELKSLEQLDIYVLYKWSLKGIYYSLISQVYIFDAYVSNINIWTSGNTFKVNLWHGVGIKNIDRKAKIGVCQKIFHGNKWYHKMPIYSIIKHPAQHIKPNLFLSTSPLMTEHFSESFGITKNECLESSYPRCQVFSYNDEELQNHIKKYESSSLRLFLLDLNLYTKSYIYMPTWRDNNTDFLELSGIDLEHLNSIMLKKNQVFIFKLHPNTKLIIDISKYSNLRLLDSKIDIYPLLTSVDVLITDYSSIYYDFILLDNKKVILFPFDYDYFTNESRDLAYDYNEFTEGIMAYSFNELTALLLDDSWEMQIERLTEIRNIFWGSQEKKSNEQIFARIIKSI